MMARIERHETVTHSLRDLSGADLTVLDLALAMLQDAMNKAMTRETKPLQTREQREALPALHQLVLDAKHGGRLEATSGA